jgi:DNA-binding response OmpR family regulator
MSMLMARVDAAASVMTFDDSIEALFYARHNIPDLLITDFRMPYIDGVELIRRFRDFPSCAEVPTVLISAHQDPDARRLALEAGTTEFLSIPFDYGTSCARFRSLLKKNRGNGAEAGTDAGANHSEAQPRSEIDMFNALIESIANRLLHKIGELDRAYAEIRTLIDSSERHIITVDQNLRIRWLSKNISEVFQLDSSRIGSDLSFSDCLLDYRNMAIDYVRTQTEGKIIQKIVRSRDGRQSYRVDIIPNTPNGDTGCGSTFIFSPITTRYKALEFPGTHH